MNFKMGTLRGTPHWLRSLILLVVVIAAVAWIAVVLSSRTPDAMPLSSSQKPALPTTVVSPTPEVTAVGSATAPIPALGQSSAAAGEPSTLNFRDLANEAARAIYTWDTRAATYSDTYGRLRSWWHVLPDDSNPLTIFAQQFEATGTNAAAYASLTGAQGYRTAQVMSSSCDGQLAQFVQQPPPWEGMHVCTVTVNVVEHATSGVNKYTAPISIVVNCPPAASAPSDRCEMVAFYAASERIVY